MNLATVPSAMPFQSDGAGPLNDDHHRELAAANVRAKKIHSAAKVASFNGWVTAAFAACSAPFAFFSISGFLIAAGLTVVAYNEFRGRKLLLQIQPTGPRLLGWNQVGFLTMIVVYSLFAMFDALMSPSPLTEELVAKPELREALGSLEEFEPLYRTLVVVMYGGIIGLSLVFQGLNAWYYFSRQSFIQRFLTETPAWVVEVQRSYCR